MIKVNLAPVDELESAFFYVPETIALLIVATIGYFGVQSYIGKVQGDIDKIVAEEQSLNANIEKLSPDLQKFDDLDKKIVELKSRIGALQSITVSRISRYKPVIVLEHLQNLRPEGLWYVDVTNTDNDKIELKGLSFDNILLAEFLTALKSTANQEVDDTDLRTSIYFSDIVLQQSELGEDPDFKELQQYPKFTINMRFAERGGGGISAQPAVAKRKTKASKTSM